MIKRVAIARAIVLNPRYLFCDEPNSGLDPQTSIVIDNLIHEITEEYNITTIINTHDMNSVMEIGQKIVYIYKGPQMVGRYQGGHPAHGQPRAERFRLRLGHGQAREEGDRLTAAGTAGEGALRTTDCAFPYVLSGIGRASSRRRRVPRPWRAGLAIIANPFPRSGAGSEIKIF